MRSLSVLDDIPAPYRPNLARGMPKLYGNEWPTTSLRSEVFHRNHNIHKGGRLMNAFRARASRKGARCIYRECMRSDMALTTLLPDGVVIDHVAS